MTLGPEIDPESATATDETGVAAGRRIEAGGADAHGPDPGRKEGDAIAVTETEAAVVDAIETTAMGRPGLGVMIKIGMTIAGEEGTTSRGRSSCTASMTAV